MSKKGNHPRKALVLDATAFYAGTPFTGASIYHVPPSVLDEVSKRGEIGRIEGLVQAGRLVARHPTNLSMQRVEHAAATTGDREQASAADLSVVALAFELKEEGFDALVLSDDYVVQNLARVMDIAYKPVMSRGIKRVVYWRYYCIGCGKTFGQKVNECDVCGSRVRRKFRLTRPS